MKAPSPRCKALVVLLMLAVCASALRAQQPPDAPISVAGTWTLSETVTHTDCSGDEEGESQVFTFDVTQLGNKFFGEVTGTPFSVSGTVSGNSVFLEFTNDVNATSTRATVNAAGTYISGTWIAWAWDPLPDDPATPEDEGDPFNRCKLGGTFSVTIGAKPDPNTIPGVLDQGGRDIMKEVTNTQDELQQVSDDFGPKIVAAEDKKERQQVIVVGRQQIMSVVKKGRLSVRSVFLNTQFAAQSINPDYRRNFQLEWAGLVGMFQGGLLLLNSSDDEVLARQRLLQIIKNELTKIEKTAAVTKVQITIEDFTEAQAKALNDAIDNSLSIIKGQYMLATGGIYGSVFEREKVMEAAAKIISLNFSFQLEDQFLGKTPPKPCLLFLSPNLFPDFWNKLFIAGTQANTKKISGNVSYIVSGTNPNFSITYQGTVTMMPEKGKPVIAPQPINGNVVRQKSGVFNIPFHSEYLIGTVIKDLSIKLSADAIDTCAPTETTVSNGFGPAWVYPSRLSEKGTLIDVK